MRIDIIVLEALLEAERDGVAAMNEVIFILRLEIVQFAGCIMQATQELEEVRMLHLKTEEVLLFLLSKPKVIPVLLYIPVEIVIRLLYLHVVSCL